MVSQIALQTLGQGLILGVHERHDSRDAGRLEKIGVQSRQSDRYANRGMGSMHNVLSLVEE
jgi:hypothetical protein